MRSTVFFSWQTDRATREGRNFIERALDDAVKRIAQDLEVDEPVRNVLIVDKDTMGVPGSPPIFQTLDYCASFLDGLGYVRPYGWIAGMEGVQNLYLVSNGMGQTIGSCVADVIEEEEYTQAIVTPTVCYCRSSREFLTSVGRDVPGQLRRACSLRVRARGVAHFPCA